MAFHLLFRSAGPRLLRLISSFSQCRFRGPLSVPNALQFHNQHSFSTDVSATTGSKDLTNNGGGGGGGGGGPIALIFDAETTGRADFNRPPSDPAQPDLVQLGMILVDTSTWTTRSQTSLLVQLREGVTIDPGAQETHGLSPMVCDRFGACPDTVARLFYDMYRRADVLVAHNLAFDAIVMEAALHRSNIVYDHDGDRAGQGFDTMVSIGPNDEKQRVCTMRASTNVLKIPGRFGNAYKWPSLVEAYGFVSGGAELEGGHDALMDARACLRVFQYLVENGAVSLNGRDASNTNSAVEEINVETGAGTTTWSPSSSTPNKFRHVRIQRTACGFTVSGGKTYMMREALKSHGGKWDWSRREWNFSDLSSLPLVEQLASDLEAT